MKNKVLIISYYFWPEENPRSQRAYELAREFYRRGFEVTIVTKKLNFSRQPIEKFSLIEIPVKTENVDRLIPSSLENGTRGANEDHTKKKPFNLRFQLPVALQFWKLFVWPSLQEYEFYQKGLKILTSDNIELKFNLTISIAYPYSSHIMAVKLLKKGYDVGTLIADCSDPYTYNPDFEFSIINYYKEKKLLSFFDFLAVPTEKAIPAFTRLGVSPKKIKVIPQGFAVNSSHKTKFKFPEGKQSPFFIYGGAFYKNIRNPENFFEALCLLKKQGKPFHFFIYTDLNNPYVKMLSQKYQKLLSQNVSFYEKLTRSSFLEALSQADYAINFLNDSQYQEPSKLIDYALVKVKTFDIKMEMKPEQIVTFINQNLYYVPEFKSDFDIVNVTDKFLALSEKMTF